MDLTLLDCMRLFSVEKCTEIILTADDESDEEYRLDGWKSFDKSCHRLTWKYCQVSKIDVCHGYIRFWIEV